MRSAITSDSPMTICRISAAHLTALLTATPAFAGHAGETDTQGLLPHELLMGLAGLAVLLLFALLALAWVVWRVRGLDRRLRDLEGGRKR